MKMESERHQHCDILLKEAPQQNNIYIYIIWNIGIFEYWENGILVTWEPGHLGAGNLRSCGFGGLKPVSLEA